MAELIGRLRGRRAARRPARRRGDLWWLLVFGGASAAGPWAGCSRSRCRPRARSSWSSPSSPCTSTTAALGIAALFALWFLAPGLRRVFGLHHRLRRQRPAVARAVPGHRRHRRARARPDARPARIRRILLTAAGGLRDRPARRPGRQPVVGGLRRDRLPGGRRGRRARAAASAGCWPARAPCGSVLLYGFPVIAAYAMAQRVFGLTAWDQAVAGRRDSTSSASAARLPDDEVRVFGTLNGPGTLAPLLALSLLCYLSAAARAHDRAWRARCSRSWPSR